MGTDGQTQATAEQESRLEEGASAPTSQERSSGSRWFDRIFGRVREPASEERASDDGGERQSEQEKPAGQEPADLTDEEWERVRKSPRFLREVQAETDRREAKRLQRAQTVQRRRERDDYDDDEEEQRLSEQQELIRGVAQHYDAALLEPVLSRLPEAERQELLKGEWVGLEGRAKLLAAAIDKLIERSRAESQQQAQAQLRRNPAFRKELLGELRAGIEEPESVPAATGAPARRDMNVWMRRALGKYRPATR